MSTRASLRRSGHGDPVADEVQSVHLTFSAEALSQLQLLAPYLGVDVGTLLGMASSEGLKQWGVRDGMDAPGLFRLWLMTTRGYTSRGATTLASSVRHALRHPGGLTAWIDAAANAAEGWRRKAAVGIWTAWCTSAQHDPAGIELSAQELRAVLARA